MKRRKKKSIFSGLKGLFVKEDIHSRKNNRKHVEEVEEEYEDEDLYDDDYEEYEDESDYEYDEDDENAGTDKGDDEYESESDLVNEKNVESRDMSLDLINKKDEILIVAQAAGIDLKDIEIDVARELVTITAESEGEFEESDGDYVSKELYWGSYSRSVVLPQEVDVELAKAEIKNGVLKISLPKLDKKKKSRVKVTKA